MGADQARQYNGVGGYLDGQAGNRAVTTIFHITTRQEWEKAQREGAYRPASLDDAGFIHFSTSEQVLRVANAFYRGQRDLVLLEVDAARLHADVRYEPPAEAPGSAERFPHLYGALNPDAVIRVVSFPPDDDGTWSALPGIAPPSAP
jgi:uncharacterized protein (DUF952 family)